MVSSQADQDRFYPGQPKQELGGQRNVTMENLLHLLLGWLLGLTTLGIAEWIRRDYRKRELVASVAGELADLQYVIAVVAFRLRTHLGDGTDEFLDWLIPIIREYDGPSRIPRMRDNLLKIRGYPEAERRVADLARRQHDVGVGLVRYDLPFLTAQSAELSICPLDFQRGVSWVKWQLDYFNQRVDFLRSQYEKTFDAAIVGDNRVVIETNLTNGYKDLASRAESIAKAIGDIRTKYRPKGAT